MKFCVHRVMMMTKICIHGGKMPNYICQRSLSLHWILMSVLTAAIFTSMPARAAEIALLAGHQANASFNISASNQWPSENLPEGQEGDSINLDEGGSWAVTLNTDYNNNPNQKIGLYYSQHDSRFDAVAGLANPALDVSFLHFIGTNIYPQGDRLSWFVTAGLGAAFYRPEDATLEDVTRFSMQIGAGANVRLAERLSLQLDVRWLPTFFNSNTSIFCSGGCAISVSSDMFSQFQLNAGVLLRF